MNFDTESIEKLDNFVAGWNNHRFHDCLAYVTDIERANVKHAEEMGHTYVFGVMIEGWRARERRTKLITGGVEFKIGN